MSRRVRLLVAVMFVFVAGVSSAGCDFNRAGNESTPDITGSAAVSVMAKLLDVPLDGTGPNNYAGLMLPENIQEVDFFDFQTAWKATFERNWIGVLRARGYTGAGWPGDVRLLTRARGDNPDSGTTKCPERNNGNTAVVPDSLAVFYCVGDTMRGTEVGTYRRGTLWVPIAELMRLSREVRIGGTALTHAQQVTQAIFVHLVASWADALPRQIRAFAATKGVQLPALERGQAMYEFGYCVAGAMGRVVFGIGEKSVINRALPPNVQHDPVLERLTTALSLGFVSNDLASCITTYWPEAGRPN